MKDGNYGFTPTTVLFLNFSSLATRLRNALYALIDLVMFTLYPHTKP